MFSLTSTKSIYSALFFTTTLSLGGVLANRTFLTATGLVGSYAGTAVVLFNRDKKIREYSERKYSELKLDLDEGFDRLQEIFQASQPSTQENELGLRQALDRLEEKLSVQLDRLNSVSLKSREYSEQKYSESKLDLDERFDRLQEIFQASQPSTQENEPGLKQNLDRLQTRVNLQHNRTRRLIQSSCNKLNHRVTELENTVNQNTVLTSQSTKSEVKPSLLDFKTDRQPPVSVKSPSHPPKTVVFIDQSNFYHSCEKIGIEPDYGSLMCMLTPEFGNCQIRIYLGVYNPPSRRQEELNRELNRLGYNVVEHSIAIHSDGSKKVVGDDNQLTCDLLTMVLNGDINERDRVVLMSGDGDFKPVLQMVKEQGISVDLIAHNPSHYLVPLVNQIIPLDRIKFDICQYKRFEAA